MQKPKKWYDVYPYGTKEGDEEAKVFRALSRHPKFDYRSTGAIIKATNISRERVEEIIDKYISCDPPLIFPHVTNEEHWGYWERCPDRVKDDERDISGKDKDGRIDKHLAGADMVDNSSAANGVACSKVAKKDIKSLADLSCNSSYTGRTLKEITMDLEERCREKDKELCKKEGWTLDV